MRSYFQLLLIFTCAFISFNCACLIQGDNACSAPANNSFHIDIVDAKTLQPITRNLRNLVSISFEGTLKPSVTKSHNIFVNFGKVNDCSILDVAFEIYLGDRLIDYGNIYLDDSMSANAECCACYLFRIADVVTENRSVFDGERLLVYL